MATLISQSPQSDASGIFLQVNPQCQGKKRRYLRVTVALYAADVNALINMLRITLRTAIVDLSFLETQRGCIASVPQWLFGRVFFNAEMWERDEARRDWKRQ